MRLLFFLPIIAFGQPTNLRIEGATSTQVVVSYTAPDTAACTFELSESSSYSPLVADVSTAYFAGSNSDTNRAVTGAGVAGVRRAVLGTQVVSLAGSVYFRSRALRADTTHYLRVTCTGGTAAATFRTGRINGITPREIPFDVNAHGNFPVPSVTNWDAKDTPLIDPQTGAAIRVMSDPREQGVLATDVGQAVLGASGWSNASNLLSASTGSLATTSASATAFVWVDTTRKEAYAGWDAATYNGLYDLGVDVYGSSAAANKDVQICLSINSGQSCHTTSVTVTMPGSTALVGTYPSEYPFPFFKGWGFINVPREQLTSTGMVTVSGSTVTRTGANGGAGIPASWFRKEWAAGSRIYIAGSSPTCASNFCTIASVQSRNSLTISESLTIGTPAVYKSANFGVMVWKSNSTGTADISVGIRLAMYQSYHQSPANNCSLQTVSTTVSASGASLGRTVTGHLCLLGRMNIGSYDWHQGLYFVGSSEYDVRPLSLISNPTNGGYRNGPNNPIRFSGTDPNTMYTSFTDSGKLVLYKITYTGSGYTTPSGLYNSISTVGNVSGYTEPLTWTGVATGASSITDQINANTAYNSTVWGTLSPSFIGIVDDYAIYQQNASGQDTVAAVWVFRASTGAFVRWFDTAANSPAGLGWAGVHNINTAGHRLWISESQVTYSNTAQVAGGKFLATITGIYKSGALSSNLALPWPQDSSYDAACAADLPQQWKDAGAVGNNCVKLRIDNQPCSAYPTTAEKAAFPCPGDAAKSYIGRNVAAGDAFVDSTSAFLPDDEAFLVVRVTPISGTIVEIEAMRDSANGYRCRVNSAFRNGRLCTGLDSQGTHTNNGWQAMFQPRCFMALYNPSDGSFVCRNEYLQRGHYDVTALPSDKFAVVGIQGFGGYYGQSSVSDGTASTGVATLQQWAGWPATVTSLSTYIQSYIAAAGSLATGTAGQYGVDWRHYNPPLGASVEEAGQLIGDTYTLTLQGGTSGVYKVASPTGLTSIKTQAWHVWAGQYVFGDMSSPATGNQITDATAWKFCYSLNAGECRSGSSAGDFYMSVPGGLDVDITQCNSSQISIRAACVFAGGPVSGQIVQTGISSSDVGALRQRSLGWAFTRPGAQYVYSHAWMFGDGKSVLATAHHLNGALTASVMIDPGSIDEGLTSGIGYVPVTVRAPSNIVVEFGYTPTFRCTSRDESCFVQVEGVQATPFKFAAESGAQTASSSTVTIPALPGRVLYWRVVTGGTPGPTQVQAIR